MQYVQCALITKCTNLNHKDQDSSTPSVQRDNSTGLWEVNNWHSGHARKLDSPSLPYPYQSQTKEASRDK